MRKLLIAAVVAAVSVAAFAVLATAGTGPGGTSWSFTFEPNKAQKAASTESVIEPAVRNDNGTPDDESDDTYSKTKKTTIFFPKGSAFDTTVPPRCKASGGEVGNSRGAVCRKAQIGTGDAISIVGPSRLAAEIKAYNKKNGIWFVVQPCASGTGPGQGAPCNPGGLGVIVLDGRLGYKDRAKTIPKLVVPTPKTLLDNNIIIQRFALKTDRITKRRTIGGKRVLVAYVLTPKQCKGKWISSAKMEYTDRAPLTVKATTPCQR